MTAFAAAVGPCARADVTVPPVTGAPTRTFPLPGDGGWDYVTYEPSRDLVFIGRFDGVQVVGAGDGHLLATIGASTGDHGVAVAPDADRVFTTDGQENRLGIYALSTLQHLGDVALPGEPDGAVYEPVTKRILAFVPDAHSIVAVEAADGHVIGSIDVAGEPESGVADGTGIMFVTIRDPGDIVRVDARKLVITARWPATCARPTPITIDRIHRRLFVGCRDRRMQVLDAENGAVVATLSIGDGTDSAAFDPKRQIAALSNGGGAISLIRVRPGDSYFSMGQIEMPRGARTMALDPAGGRLFTATSDIASIDPPTPQRPYPRLHPVPGTFRMIVLSLPP